MTDERRADDQCPDVQAADPAARAYLRTAPARVDFEEGSDTWHLGD